MSWIAVKDKKPPMRQFVLVKAEDGYVGISRLIEHRGEQLWDSGLKKRFPLFKNANSRWTALDPTWWRPIP